MLAHDLRVDLRAGQECQQDRTESGKEVDPGRERQADDVSGDGADDDFGEGDRDCHPDRQHRGDQRETDPEGGCEPDVIHDLLHVMPRRGAAVR
jgi:hypothetical protein